MQMGAEACTAAAAAARKQALALHAMHGSLPGAVGVGRVPLPLALLRVKAEDGPQEEAHTPVPQALPQPRGRLACSAGLLPLRPPLLLALLAAGSGIAGSRLAAPRAQKRDICSRAGAAAAAAGRGAAKAVTGQCCKRTGKGAGLRLPTSRHRSGCRRARRRL